MLFISHPLLDTGSKYNYLLKSLKKMVNTNLRRPDEMWGWWAVMMLSLLFVHLQIRLLWPGPLLPSSKLN